MSWDTILFDLDGTLTDSGPGIMKAAQYALGTFGITHSWQELGFFVGPPLVESFAQYFPAETVPHAVDAFRAYYREQGWLDNAPYPGVPECLQALRENGKRLYVATSKLEHMAKKVLEHFQLAAFFDGICGAPPDDPEAGKKIHVVRAALQQADCRDLRCAVLAGDRSYDVLGGHQAGLATIGVLYGYGSREELERAGADALAASPEELKTLILAH